MLPVCWGQTLRPHSGLVLRPRLIALGGKPEKQCERSAMSSSVPGRPNAVQCFGTRSQNSKTASCAQAFPSTRCVRAGPACETHFPVGWSPKRSPHANIKFALFRCANISPPLSVYVCVCVCDFPPRIICPRQTGAHFSLN